MIDSENLGRPSSVLFLFALLCTLLRLHSNGWTALRPTSHLRSETLGRGEPAGFQPLPKGIPTLQLFLSSCLLLNATRDTRTSQVAEKDGQDGSFFETVSCFLVLWMGSMRVLAVGRVLLSSFLKCFGVPFTRFFGWQGLFLSSEWNKDCPLCILNVSEEPEPPEPHFGLFQAVDFVSETEKSQSSGGTIPLPASALPAGKPALPLSFVCPVVGLVLHGAQSPELGGPAVEGPSSNERRIAGIRKRLVLFEACPSGLTDVTDVVDAEVRQMKRYKERIQNVIPLAVTREQLVAAQEIPQLVATIQVVNHLGDPKRCRIENDSFLSLYMPWGLDSRTPAMISQPSKKIRSDGSPGGWKQWRNETTESTALIDAWKAEVSKWLDDELATGLVEHGNLDFMFFAGNPQRGAFKEEVDKLLSPGIFTDECLGHTRFSDSRSGVFSKIIDIIQNPKIDSKMDLEHLKSWQFVSLIC